MGKLKWERISDLSKVTWLRKSQSWNINLGLLLTSHTCPSLQATDVLSSYAGNSSAKPLQKKRQCLPLHHHGRLGWLEICWTQAGPGLGSCWWKLCLVSWSGLGSGPASSSYGTLSQGICHKQTHLSFLTTNERVLYLYHLYHCMI